MNAKHMLMESVKQFSSWKNSTLLFMSVLCPPNRAHAMEANHQLHPKEQPAELPSLHQLVAQNKFVELLVRLRDHELGDALHEIDQEGNTPLHSAARYHFNSIATLLLRHGAHTDLKNYAGKMAFDLAQEHGPCDTSHILLLLPSSEKH